MQTADLLDSFLCTVIRGICDFTEAKVILVADIQVHRPKDI